MSELSNKSSFDEFLNEIIILKMTNLNLNNEIRHLRKNILKLQDNKRLEICEHFENCNSIRETAYNFCFEDVHDCYEALVEYFGCSYPLQDAKDYKECYKEIFSIEYEDKELEGEKIVLNVEENLFLEDLENK
jgi:hypothetical protein